MGESKASILYKLGELGIDFDDFGAPSPIIVTDAEVIDINVLSDVESAEITLQMAIGGVGEFTQSHIQLLTDTTPLTTNDYYYAGVKRSSNNTTVAGYNGNGVDKLLIADSGKYNIACSIILNGLNRSDVITTARIQTVTRNTANVVQTYTSLLYFAALTPVNGIRITNTQAGTELTGKYWVIPKGKAA